MPRFSCLNFGTRYKVSMGKHSPLQELALSRGLTVAQIAAKVGRDRQTSYNWLSGATRPNWCDVVKLAKVLKVSPREAAMSACETWIQANEGT